VWEGTDLFCERQYSFSFLADDDDDDDGLSRNHAILNIIRQYQDLLVMTWKYKYRQGFNHTIPLHSIN
jgi:hypothetical protein